MSADSELLAERLRSLVEEILALLQESGRRRDSVIDAVDLVLEGVSNRTEMSLAGIRQVVDAMQSGGASEKWLLEAMVEVIAQAEAVGLPMHGLSFDVEVES